MAKKKKPLKLYRLGDLEQNEADVNWLKAGGLATRAAAGDKEAEAELARMENTPVVAIPAHSDQPARNISFIVEAVYDTKTDEAEEIGIIATDGTRMVSRYLPIYPDRAEAVRVQLLRATADPMEMLDYLVDSSPGYDSSFSDIMSASLAGSLEDALDELYENMLGTNPNVANSNWKGTP